MDLDLKTAVAIAVVSSKRKRDSEIKKWKELSRIWEQEALKLKSSREGLINLLERANAFAGLDRNLTDIALSCPLAAATAGSDKHQSLQAISSLPCETSVAKAEKHCHDILNFKNCAPANLLSQLQDRRKSLNLLLKHTHAFKEFKALLSNTRESQGEERINPSSAQYDASLQYSPHDMQFLHPSSEYQDHFNALLGFMSQDLVSLLPSTLRHSYIRESSILLASLLQQHSLVQGPVPQLMEAVSAIITEESFPCSEQQSQMIHSASHTPSLVHERTTMPRGSDCCHRGGAQSSYTTTAPDLAKSLVVAVKKLINQGMKSWEDEDCSAATQTHLQSHTGGDKPALSSTASLRPSAEASLQMLSSLANTSPYTGQIVLMVAAAQLHNSVRNMCCIHPTILEPQTKPSKAAWLMYDDEGSMGMHLDYSASRDNEALCPLDTQLKSPLTPLETLLATELNACSTLFDLLDNCIELIPAWIQTLDSESGERRQLDMESEETGGFNNDLNHTQHRASFIRTSALEFIAVYDLLPSNRTVLPLLCSSIFSSMAAFSTALQLISASPQFISSAYRTECSLICSELRELFSPNHD
ncbi:hypothetical protein CEUSTIGMA_g4543.t1 [Chlamydomonas eustigma]|uniref:Uncharacterized protein n=1 Tax=Chlamydomonas eustigma TaxID=1157962 RepID=A0A250X1Z2_9CHLO|nr:hypothetical protein CEUSTIGMA_g4543.t1 [Chlamydomonas eustigma]|eukprot:GAX77097.1 hypothetical protein CEUSTIGMA_g4543.t1 [Chlamydomonas eustigma]